VRTSRLIWRFFLPCAALLVLTASVTGWLAVRRIAGLRESDGLESLRSKARLLAEVARPSLRGPEEADLHVRLQLLGAQGLARLTVIRADGRVLADSQAPDLAVVGAHGVEREELREALTEPFGVARRQSDTTRELTDYVALRVEEGGRSLGWVRAARPALDAQAEGAEVRMIVFGTAAGALAVSLLAAFLLARRLARPLRALTEAATAMAGGDLGRRVRVQGARELGDLAGAYNRMADELGARMGELAAEKRELDAVLAGMVEGVLAVDVDERIVLMNEAVGRILGIDPREAQGRMLWEVVRQREVAETLAAAVRDGAPRSSELRRPGRPRDRVLSLHASPLIEEGGVEGDGVTPGAPRGAVLVFHDITELRQLEQVRRDFVANASHELKTPLAAIRGLVETILDDEVMEPATQRRFLGSIRAQSERLSDLVEEMLVLSRLEGQGAQLPREPLDLRGPVADAVEGLKPLARERRQELVLESAGQPVVVLGSHESLRRVATNLIDNALKYSPIGGTVGVHVRAAAGRGVLEVSDCGPGIPVAERERVFERFYRIDKGRSRDSGGTGLGLAIVKHLVQGLHGEVVVGEAPGGGALLHVELPLAEVADDATPGT
jgi:two-component system phosphate regulon sensor histidine kinase PhoR